MDKASENLSLSKDIQDIDAILDQYHRSGLMDREKAIDKIKELRMKNEDVWKAATAALPFGSTPFSVASNEQIARELSAYGVILTENYFRNTQEGTHADT